MFINLVVIVVLAATCPCPAGGGRLEFAADGPLQHLAVDRASQTLFAGATNHLYRLNADNLHARQAPVVLGPVLDHPLCTESFGETRCSAGGTQLFDASPTDNINKVLVVDVEHRQLVTCGSVFQVRRSVPFQLLLPRFPFSAVSCPLNDETYCSRTNHICDAQPCTSHNGTLH